MIPEKTTQLRSEGERNLKNSQQWATSEGEKLVATEEILDDWYDKRQEIHNLGDSNLTSEVTRRQIHTKCR